MKLTTAVRGIALIAILLLTHTLARACLVVGTANTPVQIADEEAIIVWDAVHHREDFVRRATFRTGARDFGFLVPTPTVPTLSAVQDSVFPLLERLSAPAMTRGNLMPHDNARGLRVGSVNVLRTQRVGGYDAVVLAADDPQAMGAWLRGHGYDAPPSMNAWLAPYVAAHWAITAFKIAQNADDPLTFSLPPVRMSFSTDRPFYPYREAAEPGGRKGASRLLRVFFLSRRQAVGTFEADATLPHWPGRVVTSSSIDAVDRNFGPIITHDLGLDPAQTPSPLWVTCFEDRSSPRPAVADVYFHEVDPKTASR